MPGKRIPEKRTLLSLGVAVGALCAIAAVGIFAWSYESGAVYVDEADVVTRNCCPETQSGPGYGMPTLRVAIAAMISPETTKEYYGDLMREIGKRLGRRTVFLQRKTYAEVNHLLEKKEVDLAFVCAGPYVDGNQRFGMEILAVPVVDGKSTYRSLTIVHRDSDIRTFDDLKGRRFAFTDPDSNTGHLVPRYVLAQRGATPETFFSETFFTNSHDNSIRAVALGLADGASVDSLVWKFMRDSDSQIAGLTRVVQESPRYGIPPVVVHPSLAADTKQQLRETFLNLAQDKKVAPLLKKLRIDRFVAGQDGAYDTVRDMQSWVQLQSEPRE
ncbi:MAG: phosphate/phosphite/phosphonate ABC transporter substrate-binding protein [Hyphomicrobiales bacterium]|nr:phosphate/phosphite/phosphonate ABC transporter substrate-binding protein [Hyphomicrobiales bacterium]